MTPAEHEPWSVPLRVAEIGAGVFRHLAADEAARRRIAEALNIEAVDRLEADIQVRPRPLGGVLTGRLLGSVVQICGVSLAPFETQVSAEIHVEFTTQPEPPVESAGDLGMDDLDRPDVLEDGVLDLGHYVVEHLALELDPFPRKPGVAFEPPEGPAEPNAFAALAVLKPRSDAEGRD